ncbi:MAG: hypothetical protein WC907_03865 [Acholeplasmataceae bacterium]
MKKEVSIQKKGDGKGQLKTRKLEGLLDGEPHTFKIRPYVTEIKQVEWTVPEQQEKQKKTRRPSGRKKPVRRTR